VAPRSGGFRGARTGTRPEDGGGVRGTYSPEVSCG
jgi:hypothetical protein